jgi:hypothetical protein
VSFMIFTTSVGNILDIPSYVGGWPVDIGHRWLKGNKIVSERGKRRALSSKPLMRRPSVPTDCTCRKSLFMKNQRKVSAFIGHEW